MNHRLSLLRAAAAAALLGAAALSACDSEPAPPFEIPGEGTVEGLLFYDANEDQVFNPLLGDSALANVRLAVRLRGTNDTLPGATARTNGEGRFVLSGLAAGTHDLVLDSAGVGAGVALCQNPVPVTVNPGERRFVQIEGRPACLITIAAAEALPAGRPVVVRGIVTAAPGQLRGDYTYIQDATGGTRVFGTTLEGRGIQVGDRIEVSATTGIFNDDIQLSNPVLRRRDPAFGRADTTVTTTGALQAAGRTPTAALQGRLVRLNAARVTAGFGVRAGVNFRNAFLNDGSGEIQVRFETGVVAGTDAAATTPLLRALMAEGRCYDVVGVVGNFRGDAQIFPRTVSDVREVPCP